MVYFSLGYKEEHSSVFFVKYEDFWGGKIIIVTQENNKKPALDNKICLVMYNRKNNGYVVINNDDPGSTKISECCGKEVKAIINNGTAKLSDLLLPGFYALCNNVVFYLGSC